MKNKSPAVILEIVNSIETIITTKREKNIRDKLESMSEYKDKLFFVKEIKSSIGTIWLVDFRFTQILMDKNLKEITKEYEEIHYLGTTIDNDSKFKVYEMAQYEKYVLIKKGKNIIWKKLREQKRISKLLVHVLAILTIFYLASIFWSYPDFYTEEFGWDIMIFRAASVLCFYVVFAKQMFNSDVFNSSRGIVFCEKEDIGSFPLAARSFMLSFIVISMAFEHYMVGEIELRSIVVLVIILFLTAIKVEKKKKY